MFLERIADETGVSQEYLNKIAKSASHRYKLYRIRKRKGGYRQIAHPARPLKFLQRIVALRVFGKLPIHESCIAYIEGNSIVDHARIHVHNNYLAKYDFKDFFPSITGDDIEKLLLANWSLVSNEIDEGDIEVVKSIVCRNERLTIGAPSSPPISNTILYHFDELVQQRCAEDNVKYTRYADDLAFSCNHRNILINYEIIIENIINTIDYPELKINRDKTIHTSRKRKRLVTGVVLTSDYKISFGRNKKRKIRSLINSYKNGNLDIEDRKYLAGYLSHLNCVEPSYIENLKNKYGEETIKMAFRVPDDG